MTEPNNASPEGAGPLRVYTTEGCHLCEQALNLLASVATEPLWVELIDIAESDDLVERFGTRIPVFEWRQDASHIEWPFDKNQLSQWLQARLQR